MILWLLLAFLALFALVALFGAPYVPTHKVAVKRALKLLPLKAGDLVVDLGSGDGVFVLAAAKSGFRALGYEINPVLYAISLLRSLKYKRLVTIKLANFWHADIPKETKAVFVFAAGPYMNKLSRKLAQIAKNRQEPLYVVSYGFLIPGFNEVAFESGLYLYQLMPTKR